MVTAAASCAVGFGVAPAAMAALPAPNQIRTLTVTYQGTSATYSSTTQTESCQTTGPLRFNSGCFVGPYTTGLTAAGWTVPFAPIAIDHAAGQFTSQAPPTSLLFAGTATANGQYYDGNGDPVQSCQASAALFVDPSSPPAAMSIAVGGPQTGVITAGAPPLVNAQNVQSPCSESLPGGNPHYPDSFKAIATISPADLQQTRSLIPVDETNPGAYKLASDCTADESTYDGVDSCTQSLSWTGQIVLAPTCGTVTVTPGDGGDQTSVTFAPGQHVDADSDGTIYDFGGGAEVEQDTDGGMTADPGCFSFVPLPQSGLNLSLGSLFGKIGSVAQGVVIDAVRGAAAVTGLAHDAAASQTATFTITAGSGGRHILHVISGGVQLTDRWHGLTVPAGETVTLSPSGGAQQTQAWPASAQKLVPKGDRPPAIARLTVGGRKVRFTLSEKARVRIVVMKGKRTLGKRSARGRKGANTVTLKKAPARGTTTEVTATDSGGRVSTVEHHTR